MFKEFYRHVKQKKYWKKDQKILIAVSGGVDSMVLLDLMCKIAEKEQLHLAVAHVNHQLRQESAIEAAHISQYCHDNQLPYFYKIWQAENKQISTEEKARSFRYDFFSEVMKENSYQVLLTAHHNDDQAETILLKMTRGSAFQNLVGIRDQQPFAHGVLIRPLLNFSKEMIETFAKQNKIVYFEDSSNLDNCYTRNRMRNQVIPLVKKENPKFLKHMQSFSEEMELANQLIQQFIQPKYEYWVTKTPDGWEISLIELRNETKAVQVFFLQMLFQQTLIPEGIKMNKEQVVQILNILEDSAPQQVIMLEQSWQFKKSYMTAYLTKEKKATNKLVVQLNLNESLFVSENEWFCLELADQKTQQPDIIKTWREYSLLLSGNERLPLTLRHRKNGDKIIVSSALTKRLNRFFIDRKVPNDQRDSAWVVTSSDKKIIWVPKFINSYLSIPKETDKILYRLIYKTND